MASTLSSSIVLLMIIALATHPVQCQLSKIATGLSQVIKILEEITDTSNSFIPDIATVLSNQEMLFENSSATLDEMSTTLSRIERAMTLQQGKQERAMSTSTQTYQNIVGQISQIQNQQLTQMISVLEKQNLQLENISSVLPQLVSLLKVQENMLTLHKSSENSVASRIVATQSRMADSLDQIVSLLQIRDTPFSTVQTDVMTTNKPTTQPPVTPRDCSDISEANNHGSGVYTIDIRDGQGSFDVYCDMDTDEGGWTVFQKRFNGSVDFYLGWDDYENGFGNLQGEHWLGLQKMHRMTSSRQWTLQIDLEDLNGNTGYARYADFQIGDAESFYRLSIGAFSGDIYDALTYHNGYSFTTKDQDHDTYSTNCATRYQGAYWYNSCHYTNLNGVHQGSSIVPNNAASNMVWQDFRHGSGHNIVLKKSQMKMRPTQ